MVVNKLPKQEYGNNNIQENRYTEWQLREVLLVANFVKFNIGERIILSKMKKNI